MAEIKHYGIRHGLDKVEIPCGEIPKFPNFVQDIREVTCEDCLLIIEKQIVIARDKIDMAKFRVAYGKVGE